MLAARLLLPVMLLAHPALAQPASCPQLFPGGQPPALVNPKLAARTTPLCNDAYATLASGLTHGPLWSAEHPTASTIAEARGTPREGEFHSDSRIPAADRAELEDYARSGYDRGHMTPSGDMPNEDAQQQTFSLANMVPQTPELNRGIWADIEMSVRALAAQDGQVYVVTGPAFRGAQLQSIGPDNVLVPSATWKAIYDPQARGTGVYVCRNTHRPLCQVVAVATLVQVVGIDPFPALPASLKQIAMPLAEPGGRPSHRRRRRDPATLFGR